MDDLHAAVGVLDDGGAGIDPVAAVDVGHAVVLPDRGAVDVAADHSVHAAIAHGADHRILEVEDEADRALHLAFGVAGERPVTGYAEAAPQPGQPCIDPHQQVVADVAQQRHPAMVTGHLVEFIAVDQQVAPAVGRGMHILRFEADVAERRADVLPQGFVVIAGNEDHLLAVAGAAQDLLHHGVLRTGPVDAARHRPEVDDVADQEQVFRLVAAQEVEQPLRLAAARAEMDVGQEDGAESRAAHAGPGAAAASDWRWSGAHSNWVEEGHGTMAGEHRPVV